MPKASAYCCAEAGIIMLTKVSAMELSKYKISVNAISPGLTRTPLSE
ncbi:MAG: SDR family oxidoreductase [bacterium]|nr:SDR family oxidoreductase [bacterium]